MNTKQLLLGIVLLMAGTIPVCAQGMTATLQSGDNLSAFYGIDAFVEAYQAAKDGDQITLSAGTFNYPEDALTKSVKITGVGAFEETGNTEIKSLNVSASGVRIEGVKFTGILNPSGSENLIVVRCWLEYLYSSENYTNPLFRECVIIRPLSLADAKGFTMMNCTIKSISEYGSNNQDETNIGTMLNTVIYAWNDRSTVTAPYAIYKNCVIGFKGYKEVNSITYQTEQRTTIYCNAPSQFYYNLFYNTSDDTSGISVSYGSDCVNEGNMINYDIEYYYPPKNGFPADKFLKGIGDDGTPVGTYGGIGFSKYPAIPRLVSKTIDGYTNDEGKINVKVEVAAGQ